MVKRYVSIIFTLVTFLVIFSSQSLSQFKDYSYKVGLQGNYLIPGNEYTEDKWNNSWLIRPYATFQLSKMFDLGLGIGYGWQEGEDYLGSQYKSSFIPLDLRLIFSPICSDAVNPYIYLGAGGAYWSLDTKPLWKDKYTPSDDNGITGLGEVGLGLEIALGESWAVDLTGGFNAFLTDDFNGQASNLKDKTLHDYDRYINVGLGIEYIVGGCDTDEDNDGINKCDEEKFGTDPANPDTDGDGLKDGEEILTYKTNPLDPDTDKDGLKDGEEVLTYKTDPNKADTDGDGLKDGEEVLTYKTDPLNVDTDGDGLKDGEEVLTYKTDPTKADTDGDGLKDGEEVTKYKTDPLNPDTDGDGLKDGEEVTKYKTDPLNPDTDGDGLKDGAEVLTHKTNPLDPDTDKGTVKDGIEVNRGTDPLDPKDDIIFKGAEIHLVVNFKTNSAQILPEYYDSLKSVSEKMKQSPELEFIIVGHTDDVGSDAYNMKLSKRRAESVRTWFIKNGGIPAAKIKTEGKGETELIMNTDGTVNRPASRRIIMNVPNK